MTEVKQEDGERGSFLCTYRFGLAVLGFFVFLHNNMQRVSISVAILCMVNHTAVRLQGEEGDALIPGNETGLNSSELWGYEQAMTSENSEPQCTGVNSSSTQKELEDGPFVWDKTTQGHILGSYFYGYLVSQVPSGLLAERFGPKWPLLIFYSLATVATLLTPIASKVSSVFLIILRVIIGIGSGAMFPCWHTMWSRWAPPLERSKLAGISYAGCFAAPIVALPLAGMLCQYGFGDGWDSVFYVIGASSMIVIFLWVALSSESPAKSSRVSASEKNYIINSINAEGVTTDKVRKVPWLALLRSGPMWAIVVSNFCSDWGFYTMLTNIPSFLSEVLKFDIKSNGLFSALPFVGLWINVNISPIIADKLRAEKILTTGQVRKIFNSMGLLIPAVFLVGLGFVECTQPITGVILLVFAVTFSGCAYSGFLVNHMDIGPPFAGTLLGISNGLGAMSGFIAPSVAAALTPNQSRREWQYVFFITSALYVVGAIVYIALASGSVQPWALDNEEESEEKELQVTANGDSTARLKNGDSDDEKCDTSTKLLTSSNGELSSDRMNGEVV